jgi:RNA polymerase sigma factor (sigma-70 family)
MPPAAEAELVVKHRPLVHFLARRFARGREHELDELVGVGLEALLVAIRRFDPTRGAFGAYAVPAIRGAMLRHLRRAASVVGSTRRLASLDVSLDEPIGEGGATRLEELADDGPPVDELVGDEERRALVRHEVDRLPIADRRIVDALRRGERVGAAWRRERALELLRKRVGAYDSAAE